MPTQLGIRESPLPIPEKLLAKLWQKRAARQRDFRTGAGRRVRVLHPGRLSSAAGPDFREALLEIEGQGLVRGDVELHLRQQDWYAHGHDTDPNYNGVVLHAALELSPQVTQLQSGGQAPVISLAALVEGEPASPAFPSSAEEPFEDATGAIAISPASPPSAVEGNKDRVWEILERQGWPRPDDSDQLGGLLDAAGDARFRAKSELFRAFLAGQSPEQTLYESIMEALGYRANRQPFLRLARQAPYAALAREALAVPPSERREIIEGRLLKLSGLPPAEENSGVARAPVGSGYGSPMAAAEWHCFRVRPSNHPRHRIAGAARLLARFLPADAEAPKESNEPVGSDQFGEPTGLLGGLAEAIFAGSPARLTDALAVAADPGGKTAYVGAARARDLAVNVILPFFCAQQEETPSQTPRLEGEKTLPARRLYHRFGKLQDNELTQEMTALLVDSGLGLGPSAIAKIAATARRQQGLIHLRRQLSGG